MDRSIRFYRDLLGLELIQDAVRANLESYDRIVGHENVELRIVILLAVNLTAPFALIRSLIPVMTSAGGGRIVNVASRNAFRSTNDVVGYNASKTGLLGLTRTAAGELAKHHICVNAICRGVIHTPPLRGWVEDKQFYAAYTRQIPMGRFGKPEEIAACIAFLLSDDAEFITGQTIIADGGQIACQDDERLMQILDLGPRRKTTRAKRK